MKSNKSIKNLILRHKRQTDRETQDRILADACDYLDNLSEKGRSAQPSNVYQAIMHSRLTQLAAVAVIIIGIFVTSHYIGRPVKVCSVAMAQVSEKIDNVHTFTYRHCEQTLNGQSDKKPQTETVLYISPDHGVRLGTYVDGKAEMRTFLLPAEKVRITVMPDEKHYQRDVLSEQTFGQVQRENDPRELIRQFLASEYTDLGCKVISGIQSRGMEVHNPGFLEGKMINVVGRMWINVKTQLPVRLEIEGVDIASSKRVRIVTDEFRWEADLQKEDFGPFIPDDFILENQNNDSK